MWNEDFWLIGDSLSNKNRNGIGACSFFGILPKCESLAGVRWVQCFEKDAVVPL